MNALEKYEIEDLEDSQVQEKQTWGIDSLNSADWALRKISALKKANDEIKGFADQERERIKEWEESETKSNTDSIEFFENKLAEYLFELRKEDKKAVIKTPHGRVSTRKNSDSWEFSPDAVEEFERLELTDFIRIKKEVNKADLKKKVTVTENGQVVTEDGEVLKTVKVIPQGEKVVVKGVD